MNTINNPLILRKKKHDTDYTVNAHYSEDQSGEYIDVALAKEMLEALMNCLIIRQEIEKHFTVATEYTQNLEKLILKVKG